MTEAPPPSVPPPTPRDDAERLGEMSPIKTERMQAMRETIEGQGLSMRAMGDELRELHKALDARDASLAAANAEIDAARAERDERTNNYDKTAIELDVSREELAAANAEINRLCEVVGFVSTWINNPVSSYSVAALDGLFSLTRDKIAALASPQPDAEARGAGQKIIDGLEDALAFAKGDTTRATLHEPSHSPETAPPPETDQVRELLRTAITIQDSDGMPLTAAKLEPLVKIIAQFERAAQFGRAAHQAGVRAGREEMHREVLAPLRAPSDELIARVAAAIRDSDNGPARAAVAAIVAEIGRPT